MTIELILFVVVVALVLINNGVQLYIHFEAYPLFAYVGKEKFIPYLTEYEKRLTIPLLAPYGLTVLANIALLVIRPDDVAIVGVIVLLLLNLAVAGVSLGVATPVYNRVKEAGEVTTQEMTRLMNINLMRLVISTAASLVVLFLLLTLLEA